MSFLMKISIAIDSRPGMVPASEAVVDIAKLLPTERFPDVRVVRRYRGGRYVSVEAPRSRYKDIKSAVGAGFIVSPQFTMEPLLK